MRGKADFIENYRLCDFFFLQILSEMQCLFCIVSEDGWDWDYQNVKFTRTGKTADTLKISTH